MTQDLANLAPEHFEPLIGHTFTIGEHEVTLRDVHRRERPTPQFREPFSLVFSLPHEVPIGSEVLPVSHPALGQCDLLVTQVIDEAEGRPSKSAFRDTCEPLEAVETAIIGIGRCRFREHRCARRFDVSGRVRAMA